MQSNMNQMLQMLDRPAFFVSGGVITQANQAALSRMIPLGGEIQPLLRTGAAEYAEFTQGWMYLTLEVEGMPVGACIRRLDTCDVFTLEPENAGGEYRALALAAQELRAPLGAVLSMTERLFPALTLDDGSPAAEQTARINRGLHQMLRVICNMSDAARYAVGTPVLETRDVDAVLRELFDQAVPLCQCCGIHLTYTGLPAAAHCLVDTEQLERCIYNILSNSLQSTAPGGSIHASLTRRGNTLYLTVEDTGSGIPPERMGDVFTQFLRSPSLVDPDHGLGLGMTLIRGCASAHGGTVLLTPSETGGLKLTVSLSIRLDSTRLASPRMRVDYAGERSHGLIELSGSLPHTLYQPKKR